MKDPLAGSPWSTAGTVDGFVRSPPNLTLLGFAAEERAKGKVRAIDIGCGAGRNMIPLAEQGWTILGTESSWPMLSAARDRAREAPDARVAVALAPMERLPVRSGSMDLIVAHGIWNLARTTTQFRAAVQEAARIARSGATLFVFTFSRHTLPSGAKPVPGETFVFTQFSGEPQCFLTDVELLSEMRAVGFAPEPAVPLTEHNLPCPGQLQSRSGPVIFEAAFRHGRP